MSAELLRQAAELLRTRVQRLPMGVHEWRAVPTDSESWDGLIIDGAEGDEGWCIEAHHERVATYLEAVHPPVALALADWLEAVEYSRTPDRCADPQCGDSTWDHDCDPRPVVTANGRRAESVARAILRQPEVAS